MTRKFIVIPCAVICSTLICGCLYRGDGVFKQIGDSDYKARINLNNMVALADGRPTYVKGTVLLEDHITPLKNTHLVLKNIDQQKIVSNTYTDHVGSFNMSGILSGDSYLLEIDSPEYLGSKEITVKPNKNNWLEIIAHRK